MIADGKDIKMILAGLQNFMNARGHESLYPAVLRGVVRILESSDVGEATVTVASTADYKKHKVAIEAVLKEFQSEEEPKVILDDTIVGGYIAESSHQRLDASFKSQLVTLYRSLTNY